MSTIEHPSTITLTAADLLAMPDGKDYELVDGQLEAREVGFESVRIALRLAAYLFNYCDKMKLGWVLGSDAGYQCFSPDSQRVRRPDVSFISLEKIPLDHSPMRFIPIPPDLAVEVVSPNDLAEDVDKKLIDYQDAGVRLVWIIHPVSRQVLVHRPNSADVLSFDDELSGEDVIPRFRVKVSDVLNKFST